MKETVRIDKWLWAVRLFKTRTIATEACKKGRIMIGEFPVKPSREIRTGDIIKIKKTPVVYSFKVLQLTENRMGAKLVPEFMENVTPPDQLEMLEMNKLSGYGIRDKGSGRPTKKDRRLLEDFTGISIDEFDTDFFIEE